MNRKRDDRWYVDHRGKHRLKRKRLKRAYHCAVALCRNKSRKDTHICNTCKNAEIRKNNPLWAQWHDRAYRHTPKGGKGKDRPGCTFAEWKAFHALKPNNDCTLELIDPLGGYTLDNMRWISRE